MNQQSPPERLKSLDTYRGLVLLLLALEVPNWDWVFTAADAHPDSRVWGWIAHNFSHVPWAGGGLWDMIQPSFMFMVGVSMAYSYARRSEKGESVQRMFAHAAWRSMALILLGVFLRSLGEGSTNWTFEDVTTQIGLGYLFLFVLWNFGPRVQLGAVIAILLGYWLLFALDPVAQPAGWEWDDPAQHIFSGFEAHWNINSNPAHNFDTWWLNLFPRDNTFRFHPEGYNTLNFIPSLAVMILGLWAGEVLRASLPATAKVVRLLTVGAAAIVLSLLMHFVGIAPIVKKTWTSSFSLLSGGIALCVLALLYWLIDVQSVNRWTFPLRVFGMNSIALYAMTWLIPWWIHDTIGTHLGRDYAAFAGSTYEPLIQNLIVMFVLWLICFWMYRRKIFLRI